MDETNQPTKAETLTSPWDVWRNYADEEIDSAGASIIGDYHDPEVGFYKSAKAAQQKAATPDIFKDVVQFTKGVVLAVLSGPSANNEASTGGRLTKLLSIEGTRPWWEELSVFQGKRPPLRAIVKVRALTKDLPWPENNPLSPRDEQIISLYPEYVAIDPEMPGIGDIRAGTMVRLQHDRKYQNNGSPLPVGIIVGVIGNRPADVKEIRPSAKAGFSPKCASPLRLTGSVGGDYVGQTVALIDPGKLAKKIKNRIPLGVFGEGSIQTKSHFVASLKQEGTSLIRNIPGSIEAEKNAFVWVGHMKNNGYMDYVDRPPDLGRETIIYAPKYLDTGSPIELKYYLHDRSGFGFAWINGPGTHAAQSVKNAALEGNDFAEVIAPAIKDMMVAGRNFILVIPEMMHSRGYGTPLGHAGTSRIKALKTGQNIGAGNVKPYGTVQRVATEATMNKEAMAVMRGIIDGYSRPAGFKDDGTSLPEKKLSLIQRWKERVYSTFDNSYTGGNFSKFHGEVKSVVQKYLGTSAFTNVGYVSIHAGGASIATMATMSTYDGADSAFEIPIDRVDLIDNIGYDSHQSTIEGITKSNLGASAGSLGQKRPSAVFFENFVMAQALGGKPLEFNYFTKFDEKTVGTSNFFSDPAVDQASRFKKNYIKKNKEAGRVFSYNNSTVETKNYTSLWMSSKPLIMSLVSTNDFINPPTPSNPYKDGAPKGGYQINIPPFMRDSLPRVLNGEVPDHAAMLASKPPVSKILQLQAKEQKLVGEGNTYTNPAKGSTMHFMRNFLTKFSQSTQTGICLVPEYQAFCKKMTSGSGGLALDASENSLLQAAYAIWYNDMKELAKTKALIADALFLQWIENLPKAAGLDQINKALYEEGTGTIPRLKNISAKQKKMIEDDKFYSQFLTEAWANNAGWIDEVYGFLVKLAEGPPDKMPIFEGYVEEYVLLERKKQLEELQKKIKGQPDGPSTSTSLAGCPAPPRPLGFFGVATRPEGALTSGAIQCGSLRLPPVAPDNYLDLARLIPYFPEKKDVMGDKKHDLLMKIPGFKLVPVKHLTRRSGNNVTYMSSGDYGAKVWECLGQKIQSSWSVACSKSSYIPFRMFAGYRKKKTPNITNGISLHDLGLAIDIDPSLNGNGNDWTKGVFTNSWLRGTVENQEIDALGIYSDEAEDLMDNALERSIFSDDAHRKSEDYDDAFGVYKEDLGTYLNSAHKNNIICPIGSNPLLWVIVFCETSGMKWGNGTFMRKRYRGGSDWNPMEKNKLDRIFNIESVVDRVRAISWKTEGLNDHMHFQYWSGKSFITFEEIAEAAKFSGVKYGS